MAKNKADYITDAFDFPDFTEVIQKVPAPSEQDSEQIENLISDRNTQKNAAASNPQNPSQKTGIDTAKANTPQLETDNQLQDVDLETSLAVKKAETPAAGAQQTEIIVQKAQPHTGPEYERHNRIPAAGPLPFIFMLIITSLLGIDIGIGLIKPSSTNAQQPQVHNPPYSHQNQPPIDTAAANRLVNDFAWHWNARDYQSLYLMFDPASLEGISLDEFKSQCRDLARIGSVKQPRFIDSRLSGVAMGQRLYKLHYMAAFTAGPGHVELTISLPSTGPRIWRFDLQINQNNRINR